MRGKMKEIIDYGFEPLVKCIADVHGEWRLVSAQEETQWPE
jgi:hypothetical protein